MTVKFNIRSEGNLEFPYHGITPAFCRKILKKICSAAGLESGSISLILADNQSIRRVNADYRKKDYPTDVITFPYDDDGFPDPSAGNDRELCDIYLSLEKAKENAEGYGETLENEIKRLLVHGMLHALGYDHEISKDQSTAMKVREEEILGIIG